MSGDLRRLAELFAGARRCVAFTGAGVSTESGIPDFRSPGGLWDRFDPSAFTYRSFIGSVEGRRRYWALGRVTYPVIRAARPNAAHRALAELYGLERLDCCITQNIDGLHQRAGLPPDRVIELHGNATRARCLGVRRGLIRATRCTPGSSEAMRCPTCPALRRDRQADTVLFGEAMPAP